LPTSPLIYYPLFSDSFSDNIKYSELKAYLLPVARGSATKIPDTTLVDSMWISLLEHPIKMIGGDHYYCIELPHLIRFMPSIMRDKRFILYPEGKYSGKLSLKITGGTLRWSHQDSDYVIQPKNLAQPYQIELALEELRFICNMQNANPKKKEKNGSQGEDIMRLMKSYWTEFKDTFNLQP